MFDPLSSAPKTSRLHLAFLFGAMTLGVVSAKPITPSTPQPDTWTTGPWVWSPSRTASSYEVLFTPFTERKTETSWTRRGPRRVDRRSLRIVTKPTGDFKLTAAEGSGLTIVGTYRKTGDLFVKESSEKDIYRGLAWRWRGYWFSGAESDLPPRLKVFADDTLVPLQETPLFAAVRRGDLAALQSEPSLAEKAATQTDTLGRTLLYRAAQTGNSPIVALLLAKGVPVDLRNAPPLGRTALTGAIRLSRLKIIDQLLAAGADPNLPDAKGTRPLQIAGDGRGVYRQIVRRLLAAGANPELTNKTGQTPRDRLVRANATAFLTILDEEIAAAKKAREIVQ